MLRASHTVHVDNANVPHAFTYPVYQLCPDPSPFLTFQALECLVPENAAASAASDRQAHEAETRALRESLAAAQTELINTQSAAAVASVTAEEGTQHLQRQVSELQEQLQQVGAPAVLHCLMMSELVVA